MSKTIGAVVRRTSSLIAAVLATVVLAGTFSAPIAHADGGGELDYSVGGRGVRYLGTWNADTVEVDATWLARRWPVNQAIARLEARTGLDLHRSACASVEVACVTVMSDKRLLEGNTRARVSLWSDSKRLVAADVALDDHDTRKWSKAKRLRMLCAYIGRGAGLTKAQALPACR